MDLSSRYTIPYIISTAICVKSFAINIESQDFQAEISERG